MKLVIEPGRGSLNYWQDLWRFRELLYILVWRDIAVRYKQTLIGVAWAFVRPAVIVIGFLFFRRMAGAEPGAVPEALLVAAGALPWQFFSSALSDCASSVLGNSHLISKVYFPRIIVPAASVLTASVDFLVSFGLFLGLMLWFGYAPTWRLLLLPVIFVLLFVLSLGLGLLLAALNVKYRDFRFIVPFILQFGVFISPVGFGLADVPPVWRAVYALNPMVGLIDGFRWATLGGAYPLDGAALALSTFVAAALLFSGQAYFRRVETQFADII